MRIHYATRHFLLEKSSVKIGAPRLAETLQVLENGQSIEDVSQLKKKGAEYCLLGIPESVGVLANHETDGTQHTWNAFLSQFVNQYSNRFVSGKEIMVLGNLDIAHIQLKCENLARDTAYFQQKIHMLCSDVDDLVAPIIEKIVAAGLVPIVIGGGQNNAYPLLKGVASALQRKRGIHALNMDYQADFLGWEGRHNANSFHFAKDRGHLHKYYAFGLHQAYNSELQIRNLENTRNVGFQFLEDITYLDKQLIEAIEFVKDEHVPCGIELDMSSIRNMPSIEQLPSGFSLEQARHYVRKCAASLKTAYLHLSEASPNNREEEKIVGKALSYLVTDFVRSSG